MSEDHIINGDVVGEPVSYPLPVQIDSVEQLQDGSIRAYGTLPPAVALPDAMSGYSIGFDPAGDGYAALFKHPGTLIPREAPPVEPRGIPKHVDPWSYYGDIEVNMPPLFKEAVERAVRAQAEHREAALEQMLAPIFEDPEGRRLVREILQRKEAQLNQAALDMLIKGETDVVVED